MLALLILFIFNSYSNSKKLLGIICFLFKVRTLFFHLYKLIINLLYISCCQKNDKFVNKRDQSLKLYFYHFLIFVKRKIKFNFSTSYFINRNYIIFILILLSGNKFYYCKIRRNRINMLKIIEWYIKLYCIIKTFLTIFFLKIGIFICVKKFRINFFN